MNAHAISNLLTKRQDRCPFTWTRQSTIDLVVLTCLAILIGWVHQYGVIGPIGGQAQIMKERAFFNSDWNYFWNIISYGRRSILYPQDFFLFRPGFFLYFLLMDIFFRHNLYVIGAAGIFFHFFVCASLYIFCVRATNRIWGVLCSLFLATQYVGVTIVYWKHMNGYLFAFLFLNLAFYQIVSDNPATSVLSNGRRLTLAAFFLFCSILFHEALAYALLLSGFLFLILSAQKVGANNQENHHKVKKNLLLLTFLPPLAYFAFNMIDLLCSRPVGLFPASLDPQASVWAIMRNVAFLCGMFSVALVYPVAMPLQFSGSLAEFPEGNVYLLGRDAIHIAGAILVLLLLFYLFSFIKSAFSNEHRKLLLSWLGVLTLACLLVIILGLSTKRLVVYQGYMARATHYYFISSYLIIIATTLFLGTAKSEGKMSFTSIGIAACMSLILLWQIPCNAILVRKLQKEHVLGFSKSADLLLKIVHFIKKNPEYCYGGPLNDEMERKIPLYLLFNEKCSNLSKIPIYGYFTKQNSGVSLFELKLPEKDLLKITLRDGLEIEPHDGLTKLFGKTGKSNQLSVLLSKNEFSPIKMSVNFSHTETAGLLLGYKDEKNFISLGISDYYFDYTVVKDGVPDSKIGHLIRFKGEPFTLSIIRSKNAILLFFNGNLDAFLPLINSEMEGKVGLYFAPASQKVPFSDASVWDKSSTYDPLSTTFDSIFKAVQFS